LTQRAVCDSFNNKKLNQIEREEKVWLCFLYKLGIFLSCHLPSLLAYWIAERLADLFFLIPTSKGKSYKKATFHNLSLILEKESGNRELREKARCSYRNFARYLREFFWLPGLNRKKFFNLLTPVGLENLDYALSQKKGVIILSVHFGNWEWGGMGISLCGYPINFLVREHKNRWTNKLFYKVREKVGVKIIFLNQLKEVIRVLKNNEILTILADENIKKEVKVDFFGHRISIPAGPFKLARRTGAMIVPSFAIRSKERKEKQRGIIETPFRVSKSGQEEDSVRKAADKFIQVVQDYLYHYPDHWLLGEPKIVNSE